MAKVKLEGNQTDGYHLTVDGAPFFIKGAGLEFGQLKSLADADTDLSSPNGRGYPARAEEASRASRILSSAERR